VKSGSKTYFLTIFVILVSVSINILLLTTNPNNNKKAEQLMTKQMTGALQSLHGLEDVLSEAKTNNWETTFYLLKAAMYADIASIYTIGAIETAFLAGSEAEKRVNTTKLSVLWPKLREISQTIEVLVSPINNNGKINKEKLDLIHTSLQNAKFPHQVLTEQDWSELRESVQDFQLQTIR
jgi:hypothetical protein